MQFKRIILFLFTFICWYLGSAQIVLTAETNAPQAGLDSIYIADGATFELPEAGEKTNGWAQCYFGRSPSLALRGGLSTTRCSLGPYGLPLNGPGYHP
ncbi:MAG: hypothetical protein ACRBG0_15115 [Lewinella sp.]|jgi:hypothetical protein|uniref:hypothetical protein n=1 Tax=Lewinella sp. TaxID=2004506 RepID=UPI003D6A713A